MRDSEADADRGYAALSSAGCARVRPISLLTIDKR
jgi:hypothetical protein